MAEPKVRAGTSWVDVALVFLAAVAVGTYALSYLRPPTSSEALSGLEMAEQMVGTTLPSIEAAGGKERVEWSFTQSPLPTLAIFFRSDCPYCEQTVDEWQELAARLSSSVAFIAFGSEPRLVASEWLEAAGLTPDQLVIAAESQTYNRAWGLRGVPTTLLVSSGGTVLEAHVGVLEAEAIERLAKAVSR